MALSSACPCCGRDLRTPEELLGRQVRCPTCGSTFAADAAVPAQMAANRVPAPAAPAPKPTEALGACPCCGEQIPRDAVRCPLCHESLGDCEDYRPWEELGEVRRDAEPHRGNLILILGTASILAGLISPCSSGISALVGLPLGVLGWVLARQDLTRMRQGLMDPRGKALTEAGRNSAIFGAIFSVLCGAGVLLSLVLWVNRWRTVPAAPLPAPAPLAPPVAPGDDCRLDRLPYPWTANWRQERA